MVGPSTSKLEPAAEAVDAVRELVAAGVPRRGASEVVARLTGVAARALYKRSL